MKHLYTAALICLALIINLELIAQTNYEPYNPWSDLPNFTELVDLDGDGDLDAFTGIESKQAFPFGNEELIGETVAVLYHENNGTSAEPNFNYTDTSPLILNLMAAHLPQGANPIFRFKDMDNDGDFDLFLASVDINGSLLYFKNIGNGTTPAFERDTTYDFTLTNNEYIVDFQLHDFDEDGAPDLILNKATIAYSCDLLGCSIIYMYSDISVAKNNNGFTTDIIIDDIYTGLFPCQGCTPYYYKIFALGARNIGNETYLTYQTNLYFDYDSVTVHMQNAKLNVDWVNNEASIDLNTTTTLPYQHGASISIADINQDGKMDFADHLFYILSTDDPIVFEQIELNPFVLNPSIDSFGTNMQILDTISFGLDFNNLDISAQLYPRTGLGLKTKIIDFNNNGTLDFVIVGPLGVVLFEDYQNNSTAIQIFPLELAFNSITTYGKITDIIFSDLNNDGLTDLVAYKFSNIIGTSNFDLTVEYFELIEENNELKYLSPTVLYSQNFSLPGYDENLLDNSVLIAEDFNGDNLVDIMMLLNDTNNDNTILSIIYNTGTFSNPQYSSTPVNSDIVGMYLFSNSAYLTKSTIATDYDSDGDLDLLLFGGLETDTSSLYLYKNSGSIESPFFDELIPITNIAYLSETLMGLTTIDYNQDGNNDLLVKKTDLLSLLDYYKNGNSLGFIHLISDSDISANLWKENILFINPNEVPFILTNESKTIDNDTIVIDFDHLNLTNSIDVDPVIADKVYYTITTSVESGTLYNSNTNTTNVQTFTQEDIDNNYILYISSSPYEDDEFIFTVKHGGFELVSQTFELQAEVISSIQNNSAIALDIHPNPTYDLIYINNKDLKFDSYKIINMAGQVVTSNHYKIDKNTISVKDLYSGMYVLEISSNKSIRQASFVKH